MSEYLDLIKIYYNEKLLFLTKDKHKKCNECENDKQFKEIYGELILNCGGKCGDKIKIKLPIYKSDKDLLYFKSSLENSINWEVISKYININEKEKSDNIKLKENYEKELSSIKELFNKYNSKNINTIKEKYSQIIELKNKSKTIYNGMKLPENSSNIDILKKEYIEYSNEINKLTREIREVNDTIEYYFMTEEPKILSKEYKHEGPIKKKKKKEKKLVEPKPKQDKPEPDTDTFKKGDNVKWMSGNKELTGNIETITSKSYMICCKPDGKMYRVKKELVNLNVEEEPEEEPDEEPEEEPDEEPEEEPDEEEKPIEITIGSKVKWTKDGKEFNGDVENITSKSYIICCKPDGKKYRVPKELVSLV